MKKLIFIFLLLQKFAFGQIPTSGLINVDLNTMKRQAIFSDNTNGIQQLSKQANAYFETDGNKLTLIVFDQDKPSGNFENKKLVVSNSSNSISFKRATLFAEESGFLYIIPKGSYISKSGTYNGKSITQVEIPRLEKEVYDSRMPIHYVCAQKKVHDRTVPNDYILKPLFTDPSNNTNSKDFPDGVEVEIINTQSFLTKSGRLDLSKMMGDGEPVIIRYKFAGSSKIHELKLKHFGVNYLDDIDGANCRFISSGAKKSQTNGQDNNGGTSTTQGGDEGVVVASKPKTGPKDNPKNPKDKTEEKDKKNTKSTNR